MKPPYDLDPEVCRRIRKALRHIEAGPAHSERTNASIVLSSLIKGYDAGTNEPDMLHGGRGDFKR